MEQHAPPGGVLVTQETYKLVRGLFDMQAQEPVQVKGVSEPVQTYLVGGARPRAFRVPTRGVEGVETRMVGRETELKTLTEAVDRLQSGVGGIVTIVGEAGLGKSRLLAELQRSPIINKNTRLVEGRCLSYGTGIAYLPWLDVLRGLFGLAADDAPATILDGLREYVQTVCAEDFEDVFPYLGSLMSLPLEANTGEMLQHLGSRAKKAATFRAVKTLLSGAAAQHPLMIVFEDLHWADPTSVELLEQLLPLTDHASLLLICLFRPETKHDSWRIKETAARQYRYRHSNIWLDPLSPVESETLVSNLLHSQALPPGLQERILNQAEGNPFYVEEIINSIIESEAIRHDRPTLRRQTTPDATVNTIPDTLQGVLMSRIDRLQEETKRVLQLASVIGRNFTYRVLAEIARDQRHLEDHLITLQQDEMIREKARLPELEYIFKHELTREAAYRSLLNKERRGFHRQVADALERLYPDSIAEQVELLAYHWERADDPDNAITYLVMAGQKAADRYANTEALAFFQRALALAEGEQTYDRVLALRAKVLLDTFQGQDAARDYQLLLDRARANGDRQGELEALLGLASAYYTISLDQPDFAGKSLEMYQQAHSLAIELDDKRGIVQALIPTIWFTDYWPDYWEQAVANIEEAWAISQELGEEELIIDCMMAQTVRGLVPVAQAEELLKQLEARHDLPRLKEAYFPLEWLYLDSGDFERCIEYCDASIKLSARLDVPPVMHSTIKALAFLGLGRYDAAWAALQEEIADQEHPFGTAFKDLGSGVYYTEMMDYGTAAKKFERVIEQAERVGRAWLVSWAQEELSRALIRNGQLAQHPAAMDIQLDADILAEIALNQGNFDEALRQAQKACFEAETKSFWALHPLRGLPHVEKSHTEAERGDSRPAYLSALILQSQILLRLNRPDDVIPLVEIGIRTAEEKGYRPLQWRLRAAKAQALRLNGDTAGAVQEYKAAALIVRDLAETIGDDQLKRSFLSHPSVSLVLEHA